MLLTKKEYALHRGVSAAFISKKRIKALLAPAMQVDLTDGKLKIDFEQADAILNKSLGVPRGRRRPSDTLANDGSSDPSLIGLRCDLQGVKLEGMRLDLQKKKESLIWRDEAQTASASTFALAERHLMALSARVAPQAAKMNCQREIKGLLEAGLRATFEAIGQELTAS